MNQQWSYRSDTCVWREVAVPPDTHMTIWLVYPIKKPRCVLGIPVSQMLEDFLPVHFTPF